MSLVLEHESIKTVDVVIGGKHYGVPLLSQLSVGDVLEMKAANKAGNDAEFEWSMNYIKRYIPEDVLNTLRMTDVSRIFDALKLETVQNGSDLGES